MLNFVFDHNAFVHLFGRSDYPQIKAAIGELSQEGHCRIWFSATNLTEMMKGTTETNYHERKECLTKALALAQNRHFFPSPTDYLFLDIRRLGLQGLLEKAAFVRKLCADVLSIPDAPTFLEKYGWVQDELDLNKMEFFRNVTDAQEPVLEMSMAKRKSSAHAKCGENRRLSFLRDSVIQLLLKYAPELAPQEGEGMSLTVLLRCRPAILYFSELVRTFSGKTYLNKRRVRDGDDYDFIYALYLDVCDYLVTDDRSLRSMFKETNLPELLDRAITLEAFLENLSTPFLFPRSPIWID